jgi:hypothetical protein
MQGLQQQPTNGFMEEMSTNPFGQPQAPTNGFMGNDQSTNPFGQPQQQTVQAQPPQLQPVQTNHTGAGFGGYGPQPTQQAFVTGGAFPQDVQQAFGGSSMPPVPQQQQQPQQTNPFRQSAMPTGHYGRLRRSKQRKQHRRPTTAKHQPIRQAHTRTTTFFLPAAIDTRRRHPTAVLPASTSFPSTTNRSPALASAGHGHKPLRTSPTSSTATDARSPTASSNRHKSVQAIDVCQSADGSRVAERSAGYDGRLGADGYHLGVPEAWTAGAAAVAVGLGELSE